MADEKKGSTIDDNSKTSRQDWKDLRAKADAGGLKANTVGLDPKVFALCAQACHDMIGKLDWYKQYIHDSYMDKMRDFSDETGGQSLTRRFEKKATDVIEAMDLMKWTMEDMGDTFIRSCKFYLSTEDTNKAGFDKIGDLQKVEKIAPKAAPPTNLSPPGRGEHPTAPAPPPSADSGVPIAIEAGEGWSWNRFYDFRQALEGS
ncbi:hypothetical protein, partial [Nocardia brasiliensis]|uniref:hypothetical protein n=1 Tax=Nocardia brasiliensis TaxID=37326 RepID=UPI0004A6E1C1